METPGSRAYRGRWGRGAPGPARDLTDSEMLFLHQMYGSGARQRGVSATSTFKPLLSNAGDSFAKHGEQGVRKLRIDLGRISGASYWGSPELVNLHHRIPDARQAVQAPRQYRYGNLKPRDQSTVATHPDREVQYEPDYAQGIYNWSTRKNREIYIRSLQRARDEVIGRLLARSARATACATRGPGQQPEHRTEPRVTTGAAATSFAPTAIQASTPPIRPRFWRQVRAIST